MFLFDHVNKWTLFLVTADVIGLYPSISHGALEALRSTAKNTQ